MVCLSTSSRIDRLRFRTNILTHYNTFRGYECINLGAVFRSSSIIRTTGGSLCFICFVLGVCFLRIKGSFFRSTVEVLVAGEAVRPSEAIQMVKLSFGTNKFPDFGGSHTLTCFLCFFSFVNTSTLKRRKRKADGPKPMVMNDLCYYFNFDESFIIFVRSTTPNC